MKKPLCVVSMRLLFCGLIAPALTINATYDSSVTSLTNAAQIESAFAAAAETFQSLYTNNATINITVYWGPAGLQMASISGGVFWRFGAV